jgi:predicted nucleic acid-binding Zn ribbon protein
MGLQKKIPDYNKHTQKQSPLGDEINKLIKGVKSIRRSKFVFWEEVVGEKIARIAIPVKNKNGVLFVKVEDSVWRFELSRRKEELVSKINEQLKKCVYKEIVFI